MFVSIGADRVSEVGVSVGAWNVCVLVIRLAVSVMPVDCVNSRSAKTILPALFVFDFTSADVLARLGNPGSALAVPELGMLYPWVNTAWPLNCVVVVVCGIKIGNGTVLS